MGKRISTAHFDHALVAAIYALAAVEMLTMRPRGWGWGMVLELGACALLAFRRQAPLLAGTSAPVLLLLMPYVGPQLDEPAVPLLILAVSVYTLARWIDDLRGLLGLVVVALVMLSDYVLVDSRQHSIADVVFAAVVLTPPYVFGRLVQQLARQKALLEEREVLVTREAVRAERDRIARELHDVIAHSVSAMVVQTAAAIDLVHTDPARAEQVLQAVADTGRQALSETGRLLHVIRDDADELGLQPAPGLADLEHLADHFRASGLDVDLLVEDPLPRLPAGIDVSAYRVAEEALTNALRHGDGKVLLRVRPVGDGVEICASNPSGAPHSSPGSGLGLRGMTERVALLGGTLTHGVRDGVFELDATLPGDRA